MGGGAGCKEVGFLKGGTKPCVRGDHEVDCGR